MNVCCQKSPHKETGDPFVGRHQEAVKRDNVELVAMRQRFRAERRGIRWTDKKTRTFLVQRR